MATRRTWIWIIVACLGVIVIGLFAIAGAGVYFVASHIDTTRTSPADAMRRFDDVRATFKEQPPLFELDSNERPRLKRPIAEVPTSSVRTRQLEIMAWDADEERIVTVTVPFWLLRFGGRRIEFSDRGNRRSFDIEDLQLNVEDLERIGPVLVFDYRASSNGERVLLWTQ
jgi:hypothetical protein